MSKKILMAFLVFCFINSQMWAQTAIPVTSSSNKTDSSFMFKDVPKDHWAYDAIYELTQNGIFIGYFEKPANIFKGERTLTRYEFAYALARAVIKIEDDIRKEKKDVDIESFLKSKNVAPKDIELMTMLMQEFKTELNSLNVRMTRLEEIHKRAPHSNLPLYLSIGALLVSFAALTLALQSNK